MSPAPTKVIEPGGGGVTAVTVTAAVPLLPLVDAVIVAVPAALAETMPVAPTVATPSLSLDHVNVCPGIVAPLPSFAAAVSCAVFPTAMLVDDGETETVATVGAVTVTAADPLWPPVVAVTVAVPTAFA